MTTGQNTELSGHHPGSVFIRHPGFYLGRKNWIQDQQTTE